MYEPPPATPWGFDRQNFTPAAPLIGRGGIRRAWRPGTHERRVTPRIKSPQSGERNVMFYANRKEILDAMVVLSRMTDNRIAKPAFRCVRADTLSDRVRLTAATAKMTAQVDLCMAQIESPGQSCLIPAKELLAALRGMEDESVRFTPDGILGASGAVRFVAPPVADFPADVSSLWPDHSAFFLASELHRVLDTVAFCRAKEDKRYAFSGVQIEFSARDPLGSDRQNFLLRAVATDGRRLAVATIGMDDPVKALPSPVRKAILPGCSIPALLAALKCAAPDQLATIALYDPPPKSRAYDAGRVGIAAGNWRIRMNQSSGVFPCYQDVMPPVDECDTVAESQANDLLDCFVRGATATTAEFAGMRVDLVAGQGVRASSGNDGGGQASHSINASVGGPGLVIGINAKFLAESVKRLKAERVILRATRSNRPIRIDCPSRHMVQIIMPCDLKLPDGEIPTLAYYLSPATPAVTDESIPDQSAPIESDAPVAAATDVCLIDALPDQSSPIESHSPVAATTDVCLIDALPDQEIFRSVIARYAEPLHVISGNLFARRIGAGILIRRQGDESPDDRHVIALYRSIAIYATHLRSPLPRLERMSANSPYRRSTIEASLLTELFYRLNWTRGQASKCFRPGGYVRADLTAAKRLLMKRALDGGIAFAESIPPCQVDPACDPLGV